MASATDLISRIPFTSRDFSSVVQALSDIVKATRGDVWSDFFESNAGQTLIQMAALVCDLVSRGQDAAANELFLANCRRYESGLLFAHSVGYTPRSATAATVTVKSLRHPDALVLYGGTIPKGSKIKGANGLQYELLEDFIINAGDTVSRVPLIEGKSFTETFDITTKPDQRITSTNFVVEQDSWDLYVGDPNNPANLWSAVDNVAFESGATKTYDYTFDGLGRVTWHFGDGVAGKIPDAPVTVKYRTTNGAAGNSPVSSISGNLQVTLASPGTGTVSVAYLNKDLDTAVNTGTELHSGESQGATVASATQTGTLLHTPISSGSVTLTIDLPSAGGTLVLQDNADGTFRVVSNSTAFSLVTSALTYSTGAWSVQLSGAVAAGGPISADYFSIKNDSATQSIFIGAASGGADRESLDELRRNIPAYLRSQDKILTLQDYDDNVRRLAGIALVFADRFVSSYTANAVKLHIWTSEDITFRATSSDGTFSETPYKRYEQVQQDQVNVVNDFLRERTIVTIHNIIVRPAMLWVDIYLGNVVYDPSVALADVHQGITEAVVSVFEKSSGFAIRLADVYDAIRETKGVRYFTTVRIATGTQETSTELQGETIASASVSGTLEFPTATPGTVEITIEQTANASIVVKDDGSGHFTLVTAPSGVAISSSSIDYVTGAWTITFGALLISNQRVFASYANVTKDYRNDQVVSFDTLSGYTADPYPPPGVPTSIPPSPPYFDGVPLDATRNISTSPTIVGAPYALADVLRYAKLQDIVIEAAVSQAHFYDESYQYNNEITYSSVDDLSTDIRAINLRKLTFDLITA